MAHFQVPDDRLLFDPASDRLPLKPWPTPGNADGFRLFVQGTTGEERIGIQRGQEVELQLTGAKDSTIETMELIDARNKATIAGGGPATQLSRFAAEFSRNPGPVTVSNSDSKSDKHKFKIKALSSGATRLFARDAKSNNLASLAVVVGDFKNDSRFEVDLIANVCRGNDALKIHALQRMLNNNESLNNDDNVFEQDAPPNARDGLVADGHNMTCGLVAKQRSREVFEKLVAPVDDWYKFGVIHQPVTRVTRRTDLKYKPEAIEAARKAIVAALHEKPPKAVRVGVVDAPTVMTPKGGKLVAYDSGGHTVVIVGCNKAGTQFLYIDPWGAGSMMHYDGGIAAAPFKGKCIHLGIFEVAYDPQRRLSYLKQSDTRPNIIRQSNLTQGTFKYSSGNFLEVVAVPFRLHF